MPTGVLLIAVGLITIGWGHWLLPRRLRQIRQRFTPAGRELYDSRMQHPAARLMLAILIGVVFLLNEV
jgi:hypothetical protein